MSGRAEHIDYNSRNYINQKCEMSGRVEQMQFPLSKIRENWRTFDGIL